MNKTTSSPPTTCCSFFSRRDQQCAARPDSRPVQTSHARRFCLDDNEESCPFYLTYLLRRSRPNARPSFHDEFLTK